MVGESEYGSQTNLNPFSTHLRPMERTSGVESRMYGFCDLLELPDLLSHNLVTVDEVTGGRKCDGHRSRKILFSWCGGTELLVVRSYLHPVSSSQER